MIGAVNRVLFFQKHFLNLCEQRVHWVKEATSVLIGIACPRSQFGYLGIGINTFQFLRHMTGKSRKNGFHVQLPFTGYNLFLQLLLSVEPGHRQISLPIVNIQHTVPRQMCRACEIIAYFAFRQPEFCPHFQTDRFLTGDCQRKVDTIQCHPVNKMLPILPLPPRHCITKSTVVQEETVLAASVYRNLFIYRRKCCRHIQMVVHKPGHVRIAVIFEIVIESDSHTVCIIPGNLNLISNGRKLKIIVLSFRQFLAGDLGRVIGKKSVY